MQHPSRNGRRSEHPREQRAAAAREEQITYRYSRAVPGIELMSVRDSRRLWRVYHERYVVCTVWTGLADWTYRRRSHTSGARSNMMLEPGEVHFNTRMYTPTTGRVLSIAPALVSSAAQELGVPGAPHLREAMNCDGALFTATENLCQAVRDGATALEQQSRLAACLRSLLNFGERPGRAPDTRPAAGAIERARCYLHENFEHELTLETLAAETGLSRFHLTRAFARQIGVPPHQYLILLRLQRATALLRDGMPVVDVAANLGFADQSHFTRCFRRYWRVTPTQYARMTSSKRQALVHTRRSG
jgi:AraC-like DNA-binding protein